MDHVVTGTIRLSWSLWISQKRSLQQLFPTESLIRRKEEDPADQLFHEYSNSLRKGFLNSLYLLSWQTWKDLDKPKVSFFELCNISSICACPDVNVTVLSVIRLGDLFRPAFYCTFENLYDPIYDSFNTEYLTFDYFCRLNCNFMLQLRPLGKTSENKPLSTAEYH